MNNQRQGVIFDVEEQPDILTPLQRNNHHAGPFVAQDESPLQRPRPPERSRSHSPRKNIQNRWSQRLSSAVILNRRVPEKPSCKDVACVVLLPSILLSLVLIGVCSLFIYLHLLQVHKNEPYPEPENFFSHSNNCSLYRNIPRKLTNSNLSCKLLVTKMVCFCPKNSTNNK